MDTNLKDIHTEIDTIKAQAAATVATLSVEEVSKRALGQRLINAIWEITQALIALTVTGSVIYASVKLSLQAGSEDKTAFIFMTNVLFTVIGFYFGRTNHQKTGGVGNNPYSSEGR